MMRRACSRCPARCPVSPGNEDGPTHLPINSPDVEVTRRGRSHGRPLIQVWECKFYADASTTVTQQRVRLHLVLTAVVTEAQPSLSADIAARQRRYLIMMGIRVACLLSRLACSLWARAGSPRFRRSVLSPSRISPS